ncbi:MAG: hypothetical protein RIE86_09090 [Imperialibacter sp.]|uniref:hypothetical protein n=1 Tax=Imperialibacter sp. TaxID=2038411 RepID=UPI0032EF3213
MNEVLFFEGQTANVTTPWVVVYGDYSLLLGGTFGTAKFHLEVKQVGADNATALKVDNQDYDAPDTPRFTPGHVEVRAVLETVDGTTSVTAKLVR